VRLRNLEAWAALPGFALEQANELGHEHVTLAFRGSGLSSVSLQGGGELTLEQSPAVEFSTLHGGRIGREIWLRIAGVPPATVDDLDRRYVTPLSTLLTLAVDAYCSPRRVELATGPDEPWLTSWPPGVAVPTDETQTPDRQLLPLTALGLERLGTWLAAVDDLGPLPPVVAAAVGDPHGTLETQLLELTTVAEGLHRRDARRRLGERATQQTFLSGCSSLPIASGPPCRESPAGLTAGCRK
jgi:hypothetical protein